MKVVKITSILILGIYLAAGLYLFIAQRNFLYFPSEVYEHPFPVERFINEGEDLEVIVLNKGNENAIVYFGGNAEQVVLGAADISEQFPMHTAYLMNYRGYASSTGEPTEKNLYADALHLYDEIKKRHANVVVSGRSLGTGVATFLASSRNTVKQLVLITPYDSIRNIAQRRFPVYPMSLLLKDKYDSLARAEEIESNVLILLAEHDTVIPLKHSNRLIKALSNKQSKQQSQQQLVVKTIPGFGHNDLSDHEGYFASMREFLGY